MIEQTVATRVERLERFYLFRWKVSDCQGMVRTTSSNINNAKPLVQKLIGS